MRSKGFDDVKNINSANNMKTIVMTRIPHFFKAVSKFILLSRNYFSQNKKLYL